MGSRELQAHEIREVLRLLLRGESDRAIARLSWTYVESPQTLVLLRNPS